MKKAILLYQCGLANVIDATGQERRLIQNAFGPCEWYVAGLAAAGVEVRVMHWDGAGDAMACRDQWRDGPGDMFRDGKRPPASTRPQGRRRPVPDDE